MKIATTEHAHISYKRQTYRHSAGRKIIKTQFQLPSARKVAVGQRWTEVETGLQCEVSPPPCLRNADGYPANYKQTTDLY
jgi:hypothetical protein